VNRITGKLGDHACAWCVACPSEGKINSQHDNSQVAMGIVEGSCVCAFYASALYVLTATDIHEDDPIPGMHQYPLAS
jgi:hypothetical protein